MQKKKLIIIGTDHRIQHSVRAEPNGQWVPRTSPNFRKLVMYCVQKLGAQAILEEMLPEQEKVAPSICPQIAKEEKIVWIPISVGNITIDDALYERPIVEYLAAGVKPTPLAGKYRLPIHEQREAVMANFTYEALEKFDCALVVVGQVHLGVLTHTFDAKGLDVEALLFTFPLKVDESLA